MDFPRLIPTWTGVLLAAALLLGRAPAGAAEEGAPPKPDEGAALVVIAVLPLTGPDKELCQAVCETVVTDLARSTHLKLVESSQIEGVLKQLKLQGSGITDDATAAKIGKLLNAQKVVLGSVTRIGKTIALSVRLVDVETGKIEPGKADSKEGSPEDGYHLAHLLATSFHYLLTGQFISRPPDPPTAGPKPAQDALAQLGLHSAGIALEARLDRPDGSLYYWGEPITISFQVDQPCYVYLFNVDTSRRVTQLFPNPFRENARVEPGRWYRVPGEGEEWELAIEGELGEEEIIAVASTEPIAAPPPPDRGGEGYNSYMGKSVVPRLRRPAGASTGPAQPLQPRVAQQSGYAIKRLRLFTAQKPKE
ncbi:MAG: DUF4384 domain-containing protein [Armatimonadetes bacterium]|nr:DUF4384 domain-containing protein [Armatimonadota bacterium]